MKYRCSHCGRNFELDPKDYQRCPNCFWTTSLVSLEDGGGAGGGSVQAELGFSSEEKPKEKGRRVPRLKFWIAILVSFGIAAVAYALIRPGPLAQLQTFFPNNEQAGRLFVKPISIPFPHKSGVPKKSAPEAKSRKGLSAEETVLLTAPFTAPVPHPLADDEKKILGIRVSFPPGLIKKPDLTIWSNRDFETLLEEERRKRGIPLGWLYERSLKKIFEKHYLAGADAYQNGNYALARDEFIRALSFPVYENDVRAFRAVVLVMLRPYVNDVLGKLAVLNQYLLGQSSIHEIQSIVTDYEALFEPLETREWEQAAAKIESLKEKIKAFSASGGANRPSREEAAYPPSLAALDAELQHAVRQEAAPHPDAVVQWKALLTDLDLKEQIVRANLPASLRENQAAFDEALALIAAGNLRGAAEKLRLIQYPPELSEKAKEKIALIQKALALE